MFPAASTAVQVTVAAWLRGRVAGGGEQVTAGEAGYISVALAIAW
jgi:hypothetical protein